MPAEWTFVEFRRELSMAAAAAALGGLYVYAAYRVSPLAAAAIVPGLALVYVCATRPALGLALGFAALPLELFALPVASGSLSPSEAALVIVGASWLTRAILLPQAVRLPRGRDVTIGALLALIAIGLTVTPDTAVAIRTLVLWTLFTGAYFQAQSFTPAQMRTVIAGLALGCAVLGAIGAVNYLQSNSQGLYAGGYLTGGARASGTFTDPNYFAATLLLAIPVSLALILADIKRNLWLVPLAGLAVAGLVFSLSRGAISGMVIALLFMLLWSRVRWVALALVIVFSAFVPTGINPLASNTQVGIVTERLSTLSNPGGGPEQRPLVYRVAAEIAVEHPLIGTGVGSFKTEANKRLLYQGDAEAAVGNAHSVPLQLAVETGLIGSAAFVAFIAQLIGRMPSALRTGDPLAFALALGLSATLIGFAVQGLTVAHILTPVIMGGFMVLAGMLTGLADNARADRPITARTAGSPT